MEIVEIICAPEIHTSCVVYLDKIICEYLSLRIKLFSTDPLRPKHHYVRHYFSLIFEFGPLIKVWTMRFESKHTFCYVVTMIFFIIKNFIMSCFLICKKYS